MDNELPDIPTDAGQEAASGDNASDALDLDSLAKDLANESIAKDSAAQDNTVKDNPAKGSVADDGNAGDNTGNNVNLELLLDVDLPVSVAFGTSEMSLKDVLNLGTGSVIELHKSVNDPVSIIVNQKPIARGEVVTVDGKYGVRVLEVESTADRIRSLA